MKHIAIALFVPACIAQPDQPVGPPPPPPPVIGQIVPDHGAYGSEIEIDGSGFGASGTASFAGDELHTANVIVSWSDTTIRVRVPFPTVAGNIRITAPGGQTESPPFTPESPWPSGPSLDRPVQLLEARAFGQTFAALGLDGGAKVKLSLLDGTTANAYAIDGVVGSIDRRSPTRARLIADDAGGAAVLGDVDDQLVLFTLASGAITKHATTITGTLLAAGRDASGMFAWLQVSTTTSSGTQMQVERVRPGATVDAAWHVDRGPINSNAVLDAAVAGDGTLVVAYSQYDGSFFDNTATVGITRLAPAAAAFAATEYPDGLPWDDYIASANLTMAGDGARMVVQWSTQEYDETTDHPHPPFLRESAGTWVDDAASLAAPLDGGAFAYLPAAIATAAADDAGIAITPDVTSPATTTTVPLWPAQADALVIDGKGTLRPLIAVGGKVWFPTPPSQ